MARYHREETYETVHYLWFFTQPGGEDEPISIMYQPKDGSGGIVEFLDGVSSWSRAESLADDFEIEIYGGEL